MSAPWTDVERLFSPGRDYLVAQRTGAEMTGAPPRAPRGPGVRARRRRARGAGRCSRATTCAHRVDTLLDLIDELLLRPCYRLRRGGGGRRGAERPCVRRSPPRPGPLPEPARVRCCAAREVSAVHEGRCCDDGGVPMGDANGRTVGSGMRVLVAGAPASSALHPCRAAPRGRPRGHCARRFSTGSPANVAHLMRSSRFWLVEHDVALPFDYEVDRSLPPGVAGEPSRAGAGDPVRSTITNVMGTLHALCAPSGTARGSCWRRRATCMAIPRSTRSRRATSGGWTWSGCAPVTTRASAARSRW